jgi:hypothetical protein
MILKKSYNNETATQSVWYDSSMIFYSEMVEDPDSNKGDLYITFKNGSVYKYKDVSYEDYIIFMNGGTDASQGKALNKTIKSKYEYEKVSDPDKSRIEKLQKMLDEQINADMISNDNYMNTYFISGHRNITEEEFEMNYKLEIDAVLYENPNARFVVGDYYGVDIMAQNYLLDQVGIEPERVTVYHMFEAPRNKNEKVVNLCGGFKTDDERDDAMTNASHKDIAFVRDYSKISGTAMNILRRHKLKTL